MLNTVHKLICNVIESSYKSKFRIVYRRSIKNKSKKSTI